METSYKREALYKEGKRSLSFPRLDQLECQNETVLPFPTDRLQDLLKKSNGLIDSIP